MKESTLSAIVIAIVAAVLLLGFALPADAGSAGTCSGVVTEPAQSGSCSGLVRTPLRSAIANRPQLLRRGAKRTLKAASNARRGLASRVRLAGSCSGR